MQAKIPLRRAPRLLILFLALPVLFPALPAAAQETSGASPEAASSEEVSYHVVRPGDTFEQITELYLGSARRWEENWRLNPEIKNPNVLQPGTRLQVLVPALPPRSARLEHAARRVENQFNPQPWVEAWERDLLKPRDGVRTFEGSSAELVFADETRLVLTEQSLIILGESTSLALSVPRREIEIVRGQADLASRKPGDGPSDIIIKMGDATATPRPAADGTVEARSRRGAGGSGAQLMVYRGESALEADGAKVEVGQGMGSSVTAGQPPSPPEKLLPAPVIIQPAADSRWFTASPQFLWQSVEGARSYTLEICRDPRCTSLYQRILGLEATSWPSTGLPLEDLHWRITAVSPSGLDGYPSATARFTVVSDANDVTPPALAVGFGGERIGLGAIPALGPEEGQRIFAEFSDAGVGVERHAYLLNGEEKTLEEWQEGWVDNGEKASGTWTAGLWAVDRAGNEMSVEREFIFDHDPPVLIWGPEDAWQRDACARLAAGETIDYARAQGSSTLAESYLAKVPTFLAVLTGADRSPLDWTSSDLRRLPLTYLDWKISSDRPFILLRARGKRSVAFPGLGLEVTREHGLFLQACDVHTGVESMVYQILVGQRENLGELIFVVESVDVLGNQTRAAWPMERQKGRRQAR